MKSILQQIQRESLNDEDMADIAKAFLKVAEHLSELK